MKKEYIKNIFCILSAIVVFIIVLIIVGMITGVLFEICQKFLILKPFFIVDEYSIFLPLLCATFSGNEIIKLIKPQKIKIFKIIYFCILIVFFTLGLFYSFWDYLMMILISIGYIFFIKTSKLYKDAE